MSCMRARPLRSGRAAGERAVRRERWVERFQKAVPVSAAGAEATRRLEAAADAGPEAECIDDVAARWLDGTGAGPELVRVVALRAAGFSDRAIAQMLSLCHSRVARMWGRARTLLIRKAWSICGNTRYRAALALELAGESGEVIACVLGVGPDDATAELARIFLGVMREADPPSAQARRCWREQVRSRRAR